MTKEEEILVAAEEEFFRSGYDGASTAVIAKAAGVTHAMVNYYYRTKENLFMTILDNHVYSLLSDLKPLMSSEGDIIEVMTNVALAIFDKMNADRKFPFILQDIARTHPEFFKKYHDTFTAACMDSLKEHSARLQKFISEGRVSPCSIGDIYDTVFTLSTTPFHNISLLALIGGHSPIEIDDYLAHRREEMVKIIRARFSNSL